MARPKGTKYIETPEKMWEYFTLYKNSVKDNPMLVQDYVGKDADEVYRKKEQPLIFEGFECFLMDLEVINDLGDYFSNKNKKYSNYSTICSRIKNEIRHDQIKLGLLNLINPSITQRLNGLTEKVDTNFKLENKTPIFKENPLSGK